MATWFIHPPFRIKTSNHSIYRFYIGQANNKTEYPKTNIEHNRFKPKGSKQYQWNTNFNNILMMAAAYAMLWRWGFATLFAIVTHFSTCIFVVAIYFNQQILVCLLLLSVFCLAGNVGEQFPCEIPLEWVVFEEYKPEKLCWSQRVVKMTHTNILRCMLFFYVYSIRNIVCTVGGLCHVHNLRNDQEFSGKSFFHGFKLDFNTFDIFSQFS